MLYVKNGKNRLHAASEKSFEIVDQLTDDGWPMDACLYYKLTYEPLGQVS